MCINERDPIKATEVWHFYLYKGRFGAWKINHLAYEINKYLHAVQCTLISKRIAQRGKKKICKNKHMLVKKRQIVLIKLKSQKSESLECLLALDSQQQPFECTQTFLQIFAKHFWQTKKGCVLTRQQNGLPGGKETFSCDVLDLNRRRERRKKKAKRLFRAGATILYQLPPQHKLNQLLK